MAKIESWSAVFAASLGAFMASLDISIVNASLPNIAGEIGLSHSESGWISTTYLTSEAIAIPMTSWIMLVFRARGTLLIASIIFCISSVACGLSSDFWEIVISRIIQGLSGGIMIPQAMALVASELDADEQNQGMALFGLALILGPIIGPYAGGYMTTFHSWRYAFFINVPMCLLIIYVCFFFLRKEKFDLALAKKIDFAGLFCICSFLGALTFVLEKGYELDWLSSEAIRWNIAIIFLSYYFIIFFYLRSSNPAVRYEMLLDKDVAISALVAFILGFILYGTPILIPQFLYNVLHYSSYEIGKIGVYAGIPAILIIPLGAKFVDHIDVRLALVTGLSLMAFAASLELHLSPDRHGNSFIVPQIVRGLGQSILMIFLSTAFIRYARKSMVEHSSVIFNIARNVGGSVCISIMLPLINNRYWTYLYENSAFFDRERLDTILQQSEPAVTLAAQGKSAAIVEQIASAVHNNAQANAYSDGFTLMMGVCVIAIPFSIALKTWHGKPTHI